MTATDRPAEFPTPPVPAAASAPPLQNTLTLNAPPTPSPDQAAESRRVRTRLGIVIMCAVSLIFAIQDTMTRHLSGLYSPMLVVMLRFWFFAAFSLAVVSRAPGGIRGALRSTRPLLQVARGVLLIIDVLFVCYAFVALGLVNTHAIFAAYPLIVVALSGPVLGERVGWRRWTAVGVGFCGILLILQPGSGTWSWAMLMAFASAFSFALYGVLTRLVSREDDAMTSFLWTSLIGAVGMTVPGLMAWQPLAADDWGMLALLCLCAAVSHWLLIRAYTLAEASVLQPFAYTQLPWVAVFGIVLFGETLAPNVAAGIVIVVGAGLFSLWRSRVRAG